jgi:hypothetical protein
MNTSLVIKSLQLMKFKSLSLLAILFAACLISSCTVEPESSEPETFIYLVTLNNEPDLKSLTIVDSLNGAGRMVVPDIAAHSSSTFRLIIDRVDENRANISASQPQVTVGLNVSGAGFFTPDSVHVELTIEGFNNLDILSGSR